MSFLAWQCMERAHLKTKSLKIITACSITLIAILAIGIVQAQEPAANNLACVTPSGTSQLAFKGTVFYSSQDGHTLMGLKGDGTQFAVMPERHDLIMMSPASSAQTLAIYKSDLELSPVLIINGEGQVLYQVNWQKDWTGFKGFTLDGRLIIERKSEVAAESGFALVSADGSEEVFNNLPNILVTGKPKAWGNLGISIGFYVSPKGSQVVYDSLFTLEPYPNENYPHQIRGLSLVDNLTKTEIWRTTSNHIYDKDSSEAYWSPDGTQFVYTHQDSELIDPEIALVDATGKERVVTNINKAGDTALIPGLLNWSPDGSEIAFWLGDWTARVYQTAGVTDISENTLYILDLNTNTLDNLCLGAKDYKNRNLMWSPDGESLGYFDSGGDFFRIIDVEQRTYTDLPLKANHISWLAWLEN